jgi:WD40 repeat protein
MNIKEIDKGLLFLNAIPGAISVDCIGKYSIVAARRLLALISLDQMCHVKVFTNPNIKCEVGNVQFNPHMSKCSYFANTACDTVQLWDIANLSSPVTSLKAHGAAITGLVWSPADDYMLGTCSTDCYLKLWDIRDPSKPARSYCAFTSTPSQLRWNPLSSHNLASAHDGEVRIWDTRKTDTYVSFITAHFSTISSLDWSPKKSDQLVTCAQDRQIKVWDINTPLEFKIKGHTSKLVGKIRYTPFGEGLVTVSAKEDFQVRLWSLTNDELVNINVFSGHTNIIKSFDFRVRSDSDYQLVTCSKDGTVRKWEFNASMLEDCGHLVNDRTVDTASGRQTPDVDSRDNINQSIPSVGSNLSSSTSNLSSSIRGWIRKNKSALNADIDENMTYSQECKKIANDFDQVTLEETNAGSRSCTFRIESLKCTIKLKVTFPSVYPHGATPMFNLLSSSVLLSIQDKKKLIDKLNETAEEYCNNRNRFCMAACLSALTELLNTMEFNENRSQNSLDENSTGTESKPASMRGLRHHIIQENDGEDAIISLLKQNGSKLTADSSSTSTRRRSKVTKNDKHVPSPVISMGAFSPNGCFVYFNCFSNLDISALSKAPDSGNGSDHKSRGLYMRSYEDWKRAMLKPKRKKVDLEPEMSSLYERQSSRASVNSQDYFQNFFSGYISKELRTPASPNLDAVSHGTAIAKQPKIMDENIETVLDENGNTEQLPAVNKLLQTPLMNTSSLLQQQQLQFHSLKQRKQQDTEMLVSIAPSQAVRKQNRSKKLDLRVHVYDIREIAVWPISISLAKDYSFLGYDLREACMACKYACIKNDKPEIAKIWDIIANVCDEAICSNKMHSRIWNSHPLARNFLSQVFNYYLKRRDVQTLAILSCILSIPNRQKLCNNQQSPDATNSILDPKDEALYNHFRLFYANLLHRLGLNCQRNEVMKFVSSSMLTKSEQMSLDCSIELIREVDDKIITHSSLLSEDLLDENGRHENTERDEDTPRKLSTTTTGSFSFQSKLLFKCSLCRLPVRGLYTMCSKCCHGGHINHIKSWFSRNNICAAGCGCSCMEFMNSYPFTVSGRDATEEEKTITPEMDKNEEEKQSVYSTLTPLSGRSEWSITPLSPFDMPDATSLKTSSKMLTEKNASSLSDVEKESDSQKKPTNSASITAPNKPLPPTPAIPNFRTPSKTAGFKFRTFDYNQGYF